MFFKKDNLRLGIILGFIGPILGLIIIYFAKFSSMSFGTFMDEFFNNSKLITSVGSLSLLANVVFFTLYVNTNRDKTAKGIFLITVIYGIAILVLKII
jgi:hypothetical protein